MNEDKEKRIFKLLIIALGFITAILLSLFILFGLAFYDVKHNMQAINRNADIVQAIKSIQLISGRDGQSIQGAPGVNGTNGINSTSTIIQQPVQGIQGPQGTPGKDAAPTRQIEFDGKGNYKYTEDETWTPLNQDTNTKNIEAIQ